MNRLILLILMLFCHLLYAKDPIEQIEGSADIVLWGYLREKEPHSPDYVDNIKNTIINNAPEVNKYIMAFISNERFKKENLYTDCYVLSVLKLTQLNDYSGSLKVAQKYREVLQDILTLKIAQSDFRISEELLNNPLRSKNDYEQLPVEICGNLKKLEALQEYAGLKSRVQDVSNYIDKNENKPALAPFIESSAEVSRHISNQQIAEKKTVGGVEGVYILLGSICAVIVGIVLVICFKKK